jgi:hypothetical protein
MTNAVDMLMRIHVGKKTMSNYLLFYNAQCPCGARLQYSENAQNLSKLKTFRAVTAPLSVKSFLNY